MDSQIGSDIAKLLGTLGKSTGSTPQAAPNSDAGTAFKRALAASEQAQARATTGKHLPAASERHQTPPTETSIANGSAPERTVAAETTAQTALPGFDLLVVGEPVEQSAVLKFAQANGLSSAVLAELFPVGANDAANPSTPEGALAHAVAQVIADWTAANEGTGHPSGAEQTETLAGLASAGLPGSTGEALNNAVVALLPGATEDDEANLAGLAQAVAAELQPAIDRWQAQLRAGAAPEGALAQLSALQQKIETAIQPLAAQWMADHPAIAASAGVSADELVAKLADAAVPALTALGPVGEGFAAQAGMSQQLADTPVSPQPSLASELQAVVARWLEQAPQFERSVVSEQWLRELTGAVTPDITKWMAEAAEVRGNVTQLAANIAPQVAQALQALPIRAGLVHDTAPTLAAMPAAQTVSLMAATQSELATARASALSNPQPISVAIMGSADGDSSERPVVKPLASALMQVMAPATAPAGTLVGLPETTAMSQATLDRFALRSAGMRGESLGSAVKPEAAASIDGVKTVNVETVTALRDIVTARTLELARLGAQIDKSVTGSATTGTQTPFAGLAQGEASDTSAARLAGQSDFTFRQNLASLDRAGLSDSARLSQFSLNQNPAGREMAGRALSEALGQRLAANIAAGHYRLTFNVNPKELGAIDVVMEMRDGRLDAQINTTNAVTRELLGDSLPRLRDALQQSGINLAQLQVGSDSQQGSAQGRNGGTDNPEQQIADERLLADAGADVVSEDIELGLDLDSVDFWA